MSAQPARPHIYVEASEETAQKLQWLSAAREQDWAEVIEYLVNLEAARLGYAPPVEK